MSDVEGVLGGDPGVIHGSVVFAASSHAPWEAGNAPEQVPGPPVEPGGPNRVHG